VPSDRRRQPGRLAAGITAGGVLLVTAGWGLKERESTQRIVAEPLAVAAAAVPRPTQQQDGDQGSEEPARAAQKDPRAASPPPAADGSVSVTRLTMTTGVQGRRPLPIEGPLPNDGRPVVAYMEVANGSNTRRRVVVTFERPDSPPLGRVKLVIPARAARWRTWAQTTRIRQAGAWQAVVRDEEGRRLAGLDFVAGSAPAESGGN
jgi:hypothetical protein